MSLAHRWDERFATTSESERSWSQATAAESMFFINETAPTIATSIIDIGGGASRLVDSCVELGYEDLTVLDISSVALDEARRRLPGASVHWIVDDVTTWHPQRTYQLWHDRAVLHFLVDPADQSRYVTTATAALEPNGHLVLATFAHSGPTTCSGLAVQRWSARELASLFGGSFTLLESVVKDHLTPWGAVQPFTWALLRKSV
jgi:trans-aconitate methyltransferase